MEKYRILVNQQYAVVYEVMAVSEKQAADIVQEKIQGDYIEVAREQIEETVCEINREEVL